MAEDFVSGLCERIRARASAGGALRIRGGGTKDFYGGAPREAEVLEMSGWTGIVAYEPRELVLTVRAGTPLAEVEAALAAERQMLPFEPPHFEPAGLPSSGSVGGAATIGGAVATGLSGPRRPYAGAVRDFVLGTRVVNGNGEALAFGGRVIKNVAGYDVSRLMTGALGTLGVITEISFKVLPLPAAETTLAFALSQADAIDAANRWAGQPLPLSACAWSDGTLRVRLSGAPPAVDAAKAKLGGDEDAAGARFWSDLREQRLDFFAGDAPLWRLSVPQTAAPLALEPQLIDWGGGVRWVRGALDPFTVRSTVERVGGHATLFRGGDKSVGVFHPLPPAIMKIHRRLKAAFDPAGILNPGRMYDF
ncbi:MAG TPA: glycolate oxidase subunit GlcE [Usitatibacter sp.]|jgi:glycolate oxidase FAD binding subunit|nr:glycolate oxidase subunit GlcE [Usitatibacter sp.]